MSFVVQCCLQFLPKRNTLKYGVRKHTFLFSRIIIPFHSVVITKQCESQGMLFCMLLNLARFQASAKVQLRFSVICNGMQHLLFFVYQCFETVYQSHLRGTSSLRRIDCLTLEDGTDYPKILVNKYQQHYITSQSTEDLSKSCRPSYSRKCHCVTGKLVAIILKDDIEPIKSHFLNAVCRYLVEFLGWGFGLSQSLYLQRTT